MEGLNWININEKKPDNNQDILVLLDSGEVFRGRYCHLIIVEKTLSLKANYHLYDPYNYKITGQPLETFVPIYTYNENIRTSTKGCEYYDEFSILFRRITHWMAYNEIKKD